MQTVRAVVLISLFALKCALSKLLLVSLHSLSYTKWDWLPRCAPCRHCRILFGVKVLSAMEGSAQRGSLGRCVLTVSCVLRSRRRLTLYLALPTGLAILILGQVVRSLAMVHAAGNFSHEVAMRRRADHELVTDGIYA